MEESTSSQESPQPNKPKCCLGTLYLSSNRYDKEKSPVCVGFAKRLRRNDDHSQLTSESIPGGEFKYACLGYAAWDDEELKRAARRRTSPTDAVHLPYCEGLEIVSSAALSGRPDLLTPGGPGVGGNSSRGPAPQSGEPASGSDQQRPGRSYIPGMPGGGSSGQIPSEMDWDQFKTRFEKNSKKIIEKMVQNASYMGTTIKKSWEQIIREVTGGSGGRGGGSTGSPRPD